MTTLKGFSIIGFYSMPKTLPNNKTPHSQYKIYSQQNKTTNTAKDSRDVWQDKYAPSRVREASSQPVMVGDTPRTPPKNTKSTRIQNHSARRKLVQVASWVDEPIREQILHIAQQEGLSVSATIAALLEEILRQRFHIQQAATLETVLEKIIARSHRSLATRLISLLVRIAFDTGQTRVLATNTLGMQEGMTQENLKEILDTADRRTKANLTRKTPQLTELVQAVEKWLLEAEEGEKKLMAIVKANYVKRGIGERGRAKATIRYIQHRQDRDGQRVTRTLFGYDGALTKEQAYQMIDEAKTGTIFYRLVLSPDPRREDRYKDLDLSDITIHTMLELEERMGKQIQFIATIHDDHSPHRHVHTLVLVHKQKLTRDDFQHLRNETTGRALSQKRTRDLFRSRPPRRLRLRRSRTIGQYNTQKRFSGSLPSYQSYTCYLCNYHQSYSTAGRYRCPSCGLYLRRERKDRIYLTHRRGVGLQASLSP